jgi:hypothetical protein
MLVTAPADHDTVCLEIAEAIRDRLNALFPGAVQRVDDFDSQDWQAGDLPLLKVFRRSWSGVDFRECQGKIFYIVSPKQPIRNFNAILQEINTALQMLNGVCIRVDFRTIKGSYQVLDKGTTFPFVMVDFSFEQLSI